MASDSDASCVCDPNFAVICSFLARFAKTCGITHPNTQELQEMLENSQEVSQPLVDLHVKLLRKAKKSVSTERWERALIKFCHTYSNQDGWEIERFGYKKARLAVKLRILKMLLELQFDLNTKFKAEINRLSAEELRCQPLGRDKLGQTYWCQQDEECNLRVYREDLDDETWEIVARDREGLVQLISQLSSNDPFRKDPEAVINEDSNSLEIEKPITDTGQVPEQSGGVRDIQSKEKESEENPLKDVKTAEENSISSENINNNNNNKQLEKNQESDKPIATTEGEEISNVTSSAIPEVNNDDCLMLDTEIVANENVLNGDTNADEKDVLPTDKKEINDEIKDETKSEKADDTCIGMDLSRPPKSVNVGLNLKNYISESVGIDLSSKSATETPIDICQSKESGIQESDIKVTEVNEAGACDLSKKSVAQDLRSPCRTKPIVPEKFNEPNDRLCPDMTQNTATDLSTKRQPVLELISNKAVSSVQSHLGSLAFASKFDIVKPLKLGKECFSAGNKRLHDTSISVVDTKKMRFENHLLPTGNQQSLLKDFPYGDSDDDDDDFDDFDDDDEEEDDVDDSEVGEAIEEPLMLVRGEGLGKDCDTGNPGKDENESREGRKGDDNTSNKIDSTRKDGSKDANVCVKEDSNLHARSSETVQTKMQLDKLDTENVSLQQELSTNNFIGVARQTDSFDVHPTSSDNVTHVKDYPEHKFVQSITSNTNVSDGGKCQLGPRQVSKTDDNSCKDIIHSSKTQRDNVEMSGYGNKCTVFSAVESEKAKEVVKENSSIKSCDFGGGEESTSSVLLDMSKDTHVSSSDASRSNSTNSQSCTISGEESRLPSQKDTKELLHSKKEEVNCRKPLPVKLNRSVLSQKQSSVQERHLETSASGMTVRGDHGKLECKVPEISGSSFVAQRLNMEEKASVEDIHSLQSVKKLRSSSDNIGDVPKPSEEGNKLDDRLRWMEEGESGTKDERTFEVIKNVAFKGEAPLPVTKRFLHLSTNASSIEDGTSTVCSNVPSSKTTPKLWSIETICAPDEKLKDEAKLGANINITSESIPSNLSCNSPDSELLPKLEDKSLKRSLGIQIIKKSGTTGCLKRLSRWDVGKPMSDDSSKSFEGKSETDDCELDSVGVESEKCTNIHQSCSAGKQLGVGTSSCDDDLIVPVSDGKCSSEVGALWENTKTEKEIDLNQTTSTIGKFHGLNVALQPVKEVTSDNDTEKNVSDSEGREKVTCGNVSILSPQQKSIGCEDMSKKTPNINMEKENVKSTAELVQKINPSKIGCSKKTESRSNFESTEEILEVRMKHKGSIEQDKIQSGSSANKVGKIRVHSQTSDKNDEFVKKEEVDTSLDTNVNASVASSAVLAIAGKTENKSSFPVETMIEDQKNKPLFSTKCPDKETLEDKGRDFPGKSKMHMPVKESEASESVPDKSSSDTIENKPVQGFFFGPGCLQLSLKSEIKPTITNTSDITGKRIDHVNIPSINRVLDVSMEKLVASSVNSVPSSTGSKLESISRSVTTSAETIKQIVLPNSSEIQISSSMASCSTGHSSNHKSGKGTLNVENIGSRTNVSCDKDLVSVMSNAHQAPSSSRADTTAVPSSISDTKVDLFTKTADLDKGEISALISVMNQGALPLFDTEKCPKSDKTVSFPGDPKDLTPIVNKNKISEGPSIGRTFHSIDKIMTLSSATGSTEETSNKEGPVKVVSSSVPDIITRNAHKSADVFPGPPSVRFSKQPSLQQASSKSVLSSNSDTSVLETFPEKASVFPSMGKPIVETLGSGILMPSPSSVKSKADLFGIKPQQMSMGSGKSRRKSVESITMGIMMGKLAAKSSLQDSLSSQLKSLDEVMGTPRTNYSLGDGSDNCGPLAMNVAKSNLSLFSKPSDVQPVVSMQKKINPTIENVTDKTVEKKSLDDTRRFQCDKSLDVKALSHKFDINLTKKLRDANVDPLLKKANEPYDTKETLDLSMKAVIDLSTSNKSLNEEKAISKSDVTMGSSGRMIEPCTGVLNLKQSIGKEKCQADSGLSISQKEDHIFMKEKAVKQIPLAKQEDTNKQSEIKMRRESVNINRLQEQKTSSLITENIPDDIPPSEKSEINKMDLKQVDSISSTSKDVKMLEEHTNKVKSALSGRSSHDSLPIPLQTYNKDVEQHEKKIICGPHTKLNPKISRSGNLSRIAKPESIDILNTSENTAHLKEEKKLVVQVEKGIKELEGSTVLSDSAKLKLNTKNPCLQSKDIPSIPSSVEVKLTPKNISVVPFERLSAVKSPDSHVENYNRDVKPPSKSNSGNDVQQASSPRGLKVVPFEKLSDKTSTSTKVESLKETPTAHGIKVVPFEKLSEKKMSSPKVNKEGKSPQGIKVIPFEKLSDLKIASNRIADKESSSQDHLLESVEDMKSSVNKADIPAYLQPPKDCESVMITRVQQQLAKKLQGTYSETSGVSTDVPQSGLLKDLKSTSEGRVRSGTVECSASGDVSVENLVLRTLRNKDLEIKPVALPQGKESTRPLRGRLQVKSFAKEILSTSGDIKSKSKIEHASFVDNSLKETKSKDIDSKSQGNDSERSMQKNTSKAVKKKVQPVLSVSIVKLKHIDESISVKSGDDVVNKATEVKNTPANNDAPVSDLKKVLPSTDETKTTNSEVKKSRSDDKKMTPNTGVGKSPSNINAKKVESSNEEGKLSPRSVVKVELPNIEGGKTSSKSDLKKVTPSSENEITSLDSEVKKIPDNEDKTSQIIDLQQNQRETRSKRTRSGGSALLPSSPPLPRSRLRGRAAKIEKCPSEKNEEESTEVVIPNAEEDNDKKQNSQNTEEIPETSEEGRRKRVRVDTESEVTSENTGGKRRRLPGKRAPDMKLRRTIEQKRCEASESSSDDDRGIDIPTVEDVSTDDSHSIPLAERALNLARGRGHGRGRGGRGRGCGRGTKLGVGSRTATDSPAPSSDAPSETSKAEELTTPDTTPAKSKGPRAKRAPTLLGLDVGVDIILEQIVKGDAGSSSSTPIRQSRRIAQIKIREEAERRKIEEFTLYQLKEEQRRRKHGSKHDDDISDKRKRRKKVVESDEDYTAEDIDEDAKKKALQKKKRRKKKKSALRFNENHPWQSSSGSSSSEEEEEEEQEQTEEEEEEVDLVFKSDHEFSPESDLENEADEILPIRRARTAQKDTEDTEEPADEHACQKCNKSDHPEWILLCDKCDSGWHGSCLRPALLVIPEGDWFCPPCEHTSLLTNLEENLKEFDRNAKRRENEELRRKRLAYVGISLDNVLPNRDKEDASGESAHECKNVKSSSSASSSSSETSSSGDESEPVYQLRERRQALFSYRFNEYDDLINSAIQDELEAVKGAGNQGRGKDIATIVNAEKEEQEEQTKFPANADVQTEDKMDDKKEDEDDKEKDDDEEEDEEEEDGYIPPVRKFPVARKKHRRLNSLDISSEDDADSDEDFKGSSSDEEEEDYEEGDGDSEDSDVIGRRRKGGSRRKKNEPVRRSSRARITRFDKEFINDDSDESEPQRKKTRRIWQDSESEESDTTWGRRKRRKQTVVHKSKKKKKKHIFDSDLEITKKKKPKIKYGGLDDDDSPVRRTRGRKINYQEMAGSDTEEEVLNSSRRKLESEDEYVINEEEEEEEVAENRGEDKETDDSGEDVPPESKSDSNRDSPKYDKELLSPKQIKSMLERKCIKGKKAGNSRLKKLVIRDDSEDDEMKQLEEEMAAFAEAERLNEKLKECEEKVEDNISLKKEEESGGNPIQEEEPVPKYELEEPKHNSEPQLMPLLMKLSPKEKKKTKHEVKKQDRKEPNRKGNMEKNDDDDEEDEDEDEELELSEEEMEANAGIPSEEEKQIVQPQQPKGRIEVVPLKMLLGIQPEKEKPEVQLSPVTQSLRDIGSLALKDLMVAQALKEAAGFQGLGESGALQGIKSMADMQAMTGVGGVLSIKAGLDSLSKSMIGTQALKNMMNMQTLKGVIEPEVVKNLVMGQAAKSAGELNIPGMPVRTGQPGLAQEGVMSGVITPTKRKGRGRGKATLAAAAAAAAAAANVASSNAETPHGTKGPDLLQVGAGSKYPLPQHFQPHSGSSVITRMLQSQPVSSAPQSFTAAAAAMGHKYFGSSGNDQPPIVGSSVVGRGTASVPPYAIPPKGRIPSPYRQPPPLTESPSNSPGLGMSHYVNSPVSRGSSIRAPMGNLQQMPLRMRNPTSGNQPPQMYHTSHHPLDPSPSGGGPIVITSTQGRTGENNSPLHQQPPTSIPPSAGSPLANKSATSSTTHNTPPPPYTRPGQGQQSNSSIASSLVQFPMQPSDAPPPLNGPPQVRHPLPFPPTAPTNHLQQAQSSPPPHQGRSPVPGNFSPYHPPPPSSYHYGAYPPPPPMAAADDALPPSAYQGSPYPDHYASSDTTANLQASDGSNSKSYDEEGGGEFGGLVSYFSSQREDDLDT